MGCSVRSQFCFQEGWHFQTAADGLSLLVCRGLFERRVESEGPPMNVNAHQVAHSVKRNLTCCCTSRAGFAQTRCSPTSVAAMPRGECFPHGDALVREGYALRTAAHRWWTVNNNRVSFCGRRSNLPWAGSVKCVYRFHTYRGGTCSRAGHRSSWSWLARSQCHT